VCDQEREWDLRCSQERSETAARITKFTYRWVLRSPGSKCRMGLVQLFHCLHFPPQLRLLSGDAKVESGRLRFDQCPPLPSLLGRVCFHLEARGLTHLVAQGGRSSRCVLRLDWIRSLRGRGRRPLQRETLTVKAIPPSQLSPHWCQALSCPDCACFL
jgi:hypothetical protein